MNALLHTALLLSLTFGANSDVPIQGPSASKSEVVNIFLPGNEARVVDLIAPYDPDTFQLAGWNLAEMTAGPDCAVRLRFQGPGDARAVLAVGPSHGAAEALVIVEEIAPSGFRVEPLRTALEALVLKNQPAAIFATACRTHEPDPVVPADSLPGSPIPSGRHALLTLLALLPFIAAGLFFLRGAPRPVVTRSSVETRRRRLRLAVLVAVALGLRLFVARHLLPGDLELEIFPTDSRLWDLTHVLGTLVGLPPPNTFHAPLLNSLLQPWFFLGNALGVGGQVLWLRLPNLVLAAAMVWLLLRLGEALDAPRAGWLAAILFGLTSTLIHLSVPQGHYFLEMVACTWFLERLAVSAVKGRAVHRSLVLAGAVALWSGFMAALIVGPGILIHAILTWRRGDRRRALATILLAAALVAPVAGTALTNAANMAAISGAPATTGSATNAGLDAVYGHTAMPALVTGLRETLEFPLRVARTATGHAAPLFLLLLLALPVLRPRIGWVPLAVVLTDTALATVLPVRLINFTAVLPLVLVGGAWAATILADRWLPPRIRWPALASLVMLAVVSSTLLVTPTVSSGRPLAAYAAGWLSTGDATQALAPMFAPEHQNLPVVRETQVGTGIWLFCPNRKSWEEVRVCLDATRDRMGTYHMRYSVGTREFWEIRFPPGQHHRCPTDTADEAAPWKAGPFLLVIDEDFQHRTTGLGCPDLFDPGHCRSLGRSPELELLHCTGSRGP